MLSLVIWLIRTPLYVGISLSAHLSWKWEGEKRRKQEEQCERRGCRGEMLACLNSFNSQVSQGDTVGENSSRKQDTFIWCSDHNMNIQIPKQSSQTLYHKINHIIAQRANLSNYCINPHMNSIEVLGNSHTWNIWTSPKGRHTYIRTYARMFIHTCMYIHTYSIIQTYKHANCLHICTHARI